MPRQRLLVVDGTAVLYRAFFAIRELSTRAGQATNAIFGFIRMLSQLKEQWRPTHWVVVFDGGSPERRLKLLPDYKAQRPPMPEALRSQIPLAERYLGAADVRWVRIDHEEADDVMVSFAAGAARQGADVLVATSDKDLLQLVNESIRVVAPSGKPELTGPAEVRAKTGVAPEQVVDWLALVGDTVDNIPGVHGVGPKTAARLLDKFGTIDALWERLAEVPQESLRNKLSAGRATIERNRHLVRLNAQLEVGMHWQDAEVREGDGERLLGFFDEMEFESMARRLREPDLFR